MAVHPSNSNVLYIGGAQGGVWRSTDGGSNWTALTDKECSLAMGSIALDPVNPAVVYAATGEQHFDARSLQPACALPEIFRMATFSTSSPEFGDRFRGLAGCLVFLDSFLSTFANPKFRPVGHGAGHYRNTRLKAV